MKKLKKITEIPYEIISGFYIEIFSENEFVFSGDTQISELSESMIEIICKDKKIAVIGKNLKIDYYTSCGIRINGKIDEIKLS